MILPCDRHYINAVTEELAEQDEPKPEGMYAVRNDSGRVQDGASYFHGVWNNDMPNKDGEIEQKIEFLKKLQPQRALFLEVCALIKPDWSKKEHSIAMLDIQNAIKVIVKSEKNNG
jgi:hypothetical protein